MKAVTFENRYTNMPKPMIAYRLVKSFAAVVSTGTTSP